MNFRIQTAAVDPVSWTPLSPEVDCNSLFIRNGGAADLKIRTASSDPSTEETLTSGTQLVLQSPLPQASSGYWRFKKNIPVVWAQSAAGTGPAKLHLLL